MVELFTIEPAGEASHGACPDCGNLTRSVWGYVLAAAGARAAYFVRWTDGHRDRGAQIMISIGSWGSGSLPKQRKAFGVECRIAPAGPGFRFVDAVEMPWAHEEFLGEKLTRDAAIADLVSQEVFAILDCLITDEARFRGFVAGAAVRM